MKKVQMPKFSGRLKELRTEKGVTQVKMAELLNFGVRHYQKIENGEINIPALTLEFLADYFGVSADYLLGRSDVRYIEAPSPEEAVGEQQGLSPQARGR